MDLEFVFNLDISSYFDITLLALSFAFWILLLYSILRLLTRCCYDGRTRGIASLLTTAYLIMALINGCLTVFIFCHEVKIYDPLYHNDDIRASIRIVGSYASLFLNVLIDCLVFSCWVSLFGDLLFNNNRQSSMHKPLVRKRLIYAAISFAVFYLMVVIASAVVIEVYAISVLSLQILSYIHGVPIVMNLLISCISLCKLPLAQVWFLKIYKILNISIMDLTEYFAL